MSLSLTADLTLIIVVGEPLRSSAPGSVVGSPPPEWHITQASSKIFFTAASRAGSAATAGLGGGVAVGAAASAAGAAAGSVGAAVSVAGAVVRVNASGTANTMGAGSIRQMPSFGYGATIALGSP